MTSVRQHLDKSEHKYIYISPTLNLFFYAGKVLVPRTNTNNPIVVSLMILSKSFFRIHIFSYPNNCGKMTLTIV